MKKYDILALLISLTLIAAGCAAPAISAPPLAASPTVEVLKIGEGQSGLEEEMVTLGSLKQVDDYPLYTMVYSAAYETRARSYAIPGRLAGWVSSSPDACQPAWGCSLYAALGDEQNRLYGRNFDWRFSPALLLFTDPPDGYASVSMVDIEYLGFTEDAYDSLDTLPLAERRPLLDAPQLPFDGMNEKGLAIGMAAVPAQDMPYDANRETLDELQVIREILDHAATVDEAVVILGSYNIDMGSVPIHYLVASSAGQSALIEFYQGHMQVFRNEASWQTATNFLYASVDGQPQGQCWRYDRISRQLDEAQGRVSVPGALDLLKQVSQENTQWSVVYQMTAGAVDVVMGQDYSAESHHFSLP